MAPALAEELREKWVQWTRIGGGRCVLLQPSVDLRPEQPESLFEEVMVKWWED